MTTGVGQYHREIPLPENIWRVVEEGVRRLNPTRVLLYGSRARGTNRAGSDWDLAFDGGFDPAVWNRYWNDMIEDGPTFLPYDLVSFADADEGFRANIERDGKLLYAA